MDNLIQYNQYLSRVCEYVGIKNDIYNELLEILKNSGKKFYNRSITSQEEYKRMLDNYKRELSLLFIGKKIKYKIKK